MNFITANNYEQMSRIAANMIAAQIQSKPNCVLGLATGSTPEGVYAKLVESYENGDVDFSGVISVNLDEYVGIGAEHPQSYRYFMQKHLFDHVNICPENTFLPNGCAENFAKEGKEYDQKILDLGGIDVQILGIGNDGHIGFNEPDTCFTKNTHCVELLDSTIQANSRFFEKMEDVPRQAITMGMLSIMQARKIILLANGKAKKDVLDMAFNGPITPQIPASILQLHPNITVIYSET